jgi:hypothetical protein
MCRGRDRLYHVGFGGLSPHTLRARRSGTATIAATTSQIAPASTRNGRGPGNVERVQNQQAGREADA